MANNEQNDLDIETHLTKDQKKILEYVKNCLHKNSFCKCIILGSAGTGKSFLLNKIESFLKEQKKNVIIASYQSIAACNINGITLYKLFSFYGNRYTAKINFLDKKCFSLKKTQDDNYKIEKIYYSMCFNAKKIFFNKNIDNWLLIDEISNISLELLDDINNILKLVFDCNEIFGGVNILFFGDFYQLKPVEDNPIYIIKEKNHFIKKFNLFTLTTNLRQTNKDFFNICEGIKKSVLTSEQKKKLYSRLISNLPEEERNKIDEITHIFPTKNKCDQHNKYHLKKLNKKIYEIDAIDTYFENVILSDKEKINFQGLSQKILISENAKVMITTNFTLDDKLYNNGEICYITKIIENKFKCLKYDIYIKFDNSTEILLPEIDRSLEKYINKNMTVITFKRTMFPIQLSWAVTTHKIQGITLKEAVVDLGENNFDPVQLYVSISRVKSFDKLYITDLKLPLNKSKDRKIIKAFIEELTLNNE